MFAYKTDAEKKCSNIYKIIAILASLAGGFTVGMCSLFFASGPEYSFALWGGYIRNPLILLFNLLPPLILSIVFYFLFNRAIWSFVATNVIVMVPTLINYFKIALRGDSFVFQDMTLAGEAGQMLKNYKLFIDARIITYVIILAIGCTALALLVPGRFRPMWWWRFAIAGGILAISMSLIPVYASDSLYDGKSTFNPATDETWTDSRFYLSKGFVYPFLHSVKGTAKTPPKGYDEKDVMVVIDGYDDESIPDDKKVNIVCLMLEAYNDFSRFGQLEFTTDLYGKYRELEKMGYSGTLMTDIHAAETKTSEREFITGMPYHYTYPATFEEFSNSYVWYFRANGYTTEGAHPVRGTFYDRVNVNRNLGFENYYFDENYFKSGAKDTVTWDDEFFPAMKEIYDNRDKSKPYFSFSINYQGHGPYHTVPTHFTTPYVKSDNVPEADKNILNNYLGIQKETTELLYTYVTKMLATEEPLVMVLFGDHKPWLGNGDSTYAAYGINLDLSSEEGFFNYYSTRYLILANDAAKELCGNDFKGEGETLSPCFLMNKVFELCGYNGNEFMQYSSKVMKETPVVHKSHTLTDEYNNLIYYYKNNFAYEVQ